MNNFKIVKVDSNYCDYLRQFDNKVSYNSGIKDLRPFIGVLFEVNDCEYFAPLSSPKTKHKNMKNTEDFVKIDSGNLGAVNFNNMIPLRAQNYTLININQSTNTPEEAKYQKLLQNQLMWLNRNIKSVKNKALKLYNKYIDGTLQENIKIRCCNFPLLETKCDEYNK